jgi:ADP-ribosyl-[dinitrogen reductase] hydrolase
MDLSRAKEVAIEAAREAGAILLADFHRPDGPRGHTDKADADVEAERHIRGRLLSAFPGWRYLGEETGRESGDPRSPIWLVDPNDGTRDYLVGRRGSAVSIGLLVDRRPVLGVVFAFAYPDDRGDLFEWAEGCGEVRRNGIPVAAKLPEMLSATDEVLVSSKGDRDPEGNLRCAAPARYRTVPSIAHRLALVAAGEGAATSSLYAPCAWDYGAGHALVNAAGGVLVDEHGKEVTYAEDGTSATARAYASSSAVAAALARRPWETVGGVRRPSPLARLQPGQAIRESGVLARAQGCLLGQIAGDSLGALVEGSAQAEIAAAHPDGPRRLQDGGVWRLMAGQATDDSEMALALARSIVSSGRYSPQAALLAYRGWAASDPFDIGNTTRSALDGKLLLESQANGSLMRASPIGLYGYRLTPAEVAELGRLDSALTHPHRVCGDAVGAFTVAIAHAVASGDGPERACDAAVRWAREAGADPAVQETLAAASKSPPASYERSAGWVLVALQNAFYELLHAASLEDGVVASVRRGGDTDTNAAIAGALLGAVHGRAAVPLQWRRMILSCRPLPMSPGRPRPTDYWPVDVLELAELLLIAGGASPGRGGEA